MWPATKSFFSISLFLIDLLTIHHNGCTTILFMNRFRFCNSFLLPSSSFAFFLFHFYWRLNQMQIYAFVDLGLGVFREFSTDSNNSKQANKNFTRKCHVVLIVSKRASNRTNGKWNQRVVYIVDADRNNWYDAVWENVVQAVNNAVCVMHTATPYAMQIWDACTTLDTNERNIYTIYTMYMMHKLWLKWS